MTRATRSSPSGHPDHPHPETLENPEPLEAPDRPHLADREGRSGPVLPRPPAATPTPDTPDRKIPAEPGEANPDDQLLALREEVRQLRHAIAWRPVIDQARGVLMARYECSSRQAWDILRETSQLSNTKLRTVAAAVVAAATRGTTPPQRLREALSRATARHVPPAPR